MLKVTNCNAHRSQSSSLTIPSRPKRCGCRRRVWLHRCYHWRRQECPAVFFQIHFRTVPSQLWLEGRRETQYDLYLFAIYWIYSKYQYIKTWRISGGPTWGDVEKAASCEQGCQVHVHLLNKRRSRWLRQLCFLFLAQHVLHQVGIMIYYWTAQYLGGLNFVDNTDT